MRVEFVDPKYSEAQCSSTYWQGLTTNSLTNSDSRKNRRKRSAAKNFIDTDVLTPLPKSYTPSSGSEFSLCWDVQVIIN